MLYMSIHGYIHTWTHTYIHTHTHTYIYIYIYIYINIHTHACMHTPNSVGLLWTSDQPVAETSTWQHTTRTEDRHAPRGIRTRTPSKRAAADLRLGPRGHRDRPNFSTFSLNSIGDIVITRHWDRDLFGKPKKTHISEFCFIFWNNRTLNFFYKVQIWQFVVKYSVFLNWSQS
jgi:hypothetical protein